MGIRGICHRFDYKIIAAHGTEHKVCPPGIEGDDYSVITLIHGILSVIVFRYYNSYPLRDQRYKIYTHHAPLLLKIIYYLNDIFTLFVEMRVRNPLTTAQLFCTFVLTNTPHIQSRCDYPLSQYYHPTNHLRL